MFKNQTFGAASTGFGSFNASASTASPFSGFKPTASTSAFGAPPAFGANATPQATTGGGLFGSTNTTGGLFGNTNTPSSFGQSSGFGFGANTSGGGLFSNNAGTGLFAGNQNTSSFGAKPSGFGFGSTTTTGTTGGLFGSAPSTSTGLFGQQNNTLGGTGLFGNTTGGFGQQAATGTAHVKYNPVVGTDVVVKSGTSQNVNIKHHCITCMKEYESKSLEELRLEDYAAGRKGAPGGMFGGFQQTENKPLFGGSTFGQPATTSAPSLFGGGIGSTSGFGQTSQYPCQNMRKHARMPAHPCTHACIPQCRFNLNCNAPTFCSAHACMLAGNMHVCTCPCRSESFFDTEKCLTSGTKFHTCMLPQQVFSNNFCNRTDSFNEVILTLVHTSFVGAKMSLELANSTFDANIKMFEYFSHKIMYAHEYMVLRALVNNSKEALDNAKKSFAMASRAYDFSIYRRNNGIGRIGAATFMFINANSSFDDVDVNFKNVSNDFQSCIFYNVATLWKMKTAFDSVKRALHIAKTSLETATRDLGMDKIFPLDFTANRNKYTFGIPSNSYGAALNNSSAGFSCFGTTANTHSPTFQTHGGTASDTPSTSCNSFGAAFNSSDGEVKSSDSAFKSTNSSAFGAALNSANALHSPSTAFNTSNPGFNSNGAKDQSSSKNWLANSVDFWFKDRTTGFNLSARSDHKFSDTAIKLGNADKKASESAIKFCDTGMRIGDEDKKTSEMKFGDIKEKYNDNVKKFSKSAYPNKFSSNTRMQFGNTNKKCSDSGMKFDNTGMSCDSDKKCIDIDMKLGNAAKEPSDTRMNFDNNDMKTTDIKDQSNINRWQFGGSSMNFGGTDKTSNYTGMKFGNTNKQSSDAGIQFGGTGMKFCDMDKKYIDTDMELCNDTKKPSDTGMNFGGSDKKTSNMKFGDGKTFDSLMKFSDTDKIPSNTSMKFGNTIKQSNDSAMHFGVSNKKCIATSFKFGIGEFKNTSPIGAPKSSETSKDFEINGRANIGSKFDNAGVSSTDKTEPIGNPTYTLNTTGPEIDFVLLKLKDSVIQISDTDIKLDDIDKKFRGTDIKFVSGIGIKFGSSGVTNTSSKNDNAGASSTNNEFSADEGKIAKGGFRSEVTSIKCEKDRPTPADDSLEFEKRSKSEDTDLKLDGTDSKDSKFENKISDSNYDSVIRNNINVGHESIGKATYLIIEHGKIVHKETMSPGSKVGSNRKIIKNETHSKDNYFENDNGEPNSQNDSLKIEKGGPNSEEGSRNIGKDDRERDREYLDTDRDGTGSNDGSLEINKDGPNSREDSRDIEKDGSASEGECLKIDRDGASSRYSSLKIDKGDSDSLNDSLNIAKDDTESGGECLKIDRDGASSEYGSLKTDKGDSDSLNDSLNIAKV